MTDYDIRGRAVAHAFYGELEKIARANPADLASSLKGFTRAAKSADPSARKALLHNTGHSGIDSMRNKWALRKARRAATREANTKLKAMSAEARKALEHGTPTEKARALSRIEGIEEARGTRHKPKAKSMKDYLPSSSGPKKGMSGPKWAATGVGAGAAGTLLAQNQIASAGQGGGGGEYY